MSKKILLADDSITIQKVISITFASEDYELTVVSDGDSAVRKAKEARPDLIMADVAMPGKNGYEVCESVKSDASLRNTPVLLLAGTFEPLDKNEASRVGADDSIVKPFESQELIEKVRELLAKAEARAQSPRPAQSAERPAEGRREQVLETSSDIWESGDFLGFTEESAAEKEADRGGAPELDFLDSGGLFEEPHKELTSPEQDFTDLEFREDELKPAEPQAGKEERQNVEFDIAPPVAQPFEVEPFEVESFRSEPFEVKRPEAPSAEPFAFDTSSFWAEPAKKESPVREEPIEAFELPGEEPEPDRRGFAGEPITPIREVIEHPVAEVLEIGAERVEEMAKEAVYSRPEALSLPKEEVSLIVSKVAREVVERIAWEVVPELAEELIRAEINRVKEALTKLK
ncbi:MAG: response regulator [Deltaproteobacteria bacterium]|nr:response regulator [Deltaproteobacteria bacterium]